MKRAALIGVVLILGYASYATGETAAGKTGAKPTTPKKAPTSYPSPRIAPANRPPVVAITAPAANTTVPMSGFAVNGTASDPAGNPAGVAEVRVTVKTGTATLVNHARATYDTVKRSWSYQVPGTNLKSGSTTITARAKDKNGAWSTPRTIRVTGLRLGDANEDGALTYSDPLSTLRWLFQGGPQPAGAKPRRGADTNMDGRIDLSDAVKTFQENPGLGDFDQNKSVNVADSIAMLMLISQNQPPSPAQLACCDADGDGKITGKDAALALESDSRLQKK